jgi:hypothetical protein
MKLRLVSDWKSFWRWYSIHSMTLSIALLGAWAALPERFQDSFSPFEMKIMAIMLIVLGIGGRLVEQVPKKEPNA